MYCLRCMDGPNQNSSIIHFLICITVVGFDPFPCPVMDKFSSIQDQFQSLDRVTGLGCSPGLQQIITFDNINDYIGINELTSYRGLQIVHINTRSIYPKIEQIRHEFVSDALDVLCITESWLTPSIPDNFVSLKGFDIIRNDRLGKRGGGTCVFINSRIKYAVTLPKFNNKLIEMQCGESARWRQRQNMS